MDILGLLFSFTVFFSVVVSTREDAGRQKPATEVFTESTDFLSIAGMPAFVDKSTYLEKVFKYYPAKLVISPKGYAKSTNLDMIRVFASIPVSETGEPVEPNTTEAYRVFSKLKVFGKEKVFDRYFAEFPVLYLDLTCDGPLVDRRDVLDMLRRKIHATYKLHSYLQHSGTIDYGDTVWCKLWSGEDTYVGMSDESALTGLRDLARNLYLHFEKTKLLVLVDNFDSMIRTAKRRMNATERIFVDLVITDQLSYLVKENEHVAISLVTGNSSVTEYHGYNGVNNLDVYRLADDHRDNKYLNFFGFTPKETWKLLLRPQFNLQKKTARAVMKRLRFKCTSGRYTFCPTDVLNYLNATVNKAT